MIKFNSPIIAIVGPTATGKTDLAIKLALEFNGEIVCADSRTIYRGMDIGTAKPTAAERAQVRHHLLDVVDPGERLGAGEFKQLAEQSIVDIAARGKLPLLVGGSGLYADAVLYDYEFPAVADETTRERLEKMDDGALKKLLEESAPEAFSRVDLANRRRVIRAIETVGMKSKKRQTVRPEFLVLGMTLNKEIVQSRVQKRIEKMLEEGFIDEVETIGKQYGWDNSAFDVIGYRAFKALHFGAKTLDNAKADFARGDMALYKKQVTWFKRNPEIRWCENQTHAQEMVELFLAKTLAKK